MCRLLGQAMFRLQLKAHLLVRAMNRPLHYQLTPWAMTKDTTGLVAAKRATMEHVKTNFVVVDTVFVDVLINIVVTDVNMVTASAEVAEEAAVATIVLLLPMTRVLLLLVLVTRSPNGKIFELSKIK
ncbi:hypothetical protein LINGRAHAP2_LOCUS8165 [Linum grandiflorum]